MVYFICQVLKPLSRLCRQEWGFILPIPNLPPSTSVINGKMEKCFALTCFDNESHWEKCFSFYSNAKNKKRNPLLKSVVIFVENMNLLYNLLTLQE